MELSEMSIIHLLIGSKPRKKGVRCINELRKYLNQVGINVSLRHCYYYLFSQKLIDPTEKDYQNLSRWLEWAKRKKIIPWDEIIDTSRETHKLSLSGDIIGYLTSQAWQYYTRDYWRAQNNLVIVLCEKEAVAPSIVDSIAVKYGVPIFVTRGYLSYGSLYQDIVKFLQGYNSYNLPIVVLVLTDLDVDGLLIYEDIKKKMAYAQKEWGIQIASQNIQRIALTTAQATSLNLNQYEYPIFKTNQQAYIDLQNKYGWGSFPSYNKNRKENSMGKKLTKARSFIQNYGWKGIELDVLKPNELTTIIENAMKPYFDSNALQLEKSKTQLERDSLYIELLIDQSQIDNAANMADVQALQSQLDAVKKKYGIT
jgi:hypothetical protein